MDFPTWVVFRETYLSTFFPNRAHENQVAKIEKKITPVQAELNLYEQPTKLIDQQIGSWIIIAPTLPWKYISRASDVDEHSPLPFSFFVFVV